MCAPRWAIAITQEGNGARTGRSGLTFDEDSRKEETSRKVPKSNCRLHSSAVPGNVDPIRLRPCATATEKRVLTNQPIERETPPRNSAC